MTHCYFDEIHGFASPSEFSRFVDFIEAQVLIGAVEEFPADLEYCAGKIHGGRWFKDRSYGQIWRLVAPDFPFRGLWESVSTGPVHFGTNHQTNTDSPPNHRAATTMRNRPFQPSKGYPVGQNFFYRCRLCHDVVASQPEESVGCRCRNIFIDADCARISAKDDSQIDLLESTPR